MRRFLALGTFTLLVELDVGFGAYGATLQLGRRLAGEELYGVHRFSARADSFLMSVVISLHFHLSQN